MSGEAPKRRRPSRQRMIVLRAAASLGHAFSIEELVGRSRLLEPGIGTATVYRAVSALCEQGLMEAVSRRGGRALYACCPGEGHHHHAVCVSCGAVSEAACPVDETALSSAVDEGFVVTGHQVNLYGICGRCAARAEET